MQIGVLGATGYVGSELLRLMAASDLHEVAVVQGSGSVGRFVAEVAPNLAAGYPELVVGPLELRALFGLDLVFCALPSGEASKIVPELVGRVGHIVDCSADFRLADPRSYEQWYGFVHPCPELLERFVPGLVELRRDELAGAELVAAPGCYVTAATLALRPLLDAGHVGSGPLIVNGASGASGAGRSTDQSTQLCEANESYRAYALDGHRHTPEMEQWLGTPVMFTPHLLPMNRGLLVTCYAQPGPSGLVPTAELQAVLRRRYADERFVKVLDSSPATGAITGANLCHITASTDERTSTVRVIAALDNLVKGAAGQALQAANLALGIDEHAGLPAVGMRP
jgi:N-acetyl-gamma-glutamyl-phosphate reductase